MGNYNRMCNNSVTGGIYRQRCLVDEDNARHQLFVTGIVWDN